MALGTGSRLPSGRSANFWAALAARSPGSGVSALLSVSLGLYEGSRNTKSVGDDAFATFGIAGGALIASSCLGAATGAAAGFITSDATLFAAACHIYLLQCGRRHRVGARLLRLRRSRDEYHHQQRHENTQQLLAHFASPRRA